MVQQGYDHVDERVEVLIGRHVGESPHKHITHKKREEFNTSNIKKKSKYYDKFVYFRIRHLLYSSFS